MEAAEAQALLWQKADIITPMAMRVAATLGLADHIAAGHTTVAALATAAEVDADALERVVRFLATEDVLTLGEDGEVGLASIGELLRSDHPAAGRRWFDLEGFAGRMDRCLFELLDAVRTGRSVYEKVHGRPFWQDLDANPSIGASFNGLMAAQAATTHPHIVEAYPWKELASVVDVGGGTGTLVAALAEAVPALRASVFDLPAAVAGARERFARNGLADRCTAEAGSFFESIPAGADAYLLTSVLHDWGDDDALRILERCAEAAGERGRVLVIDAVMQADQPRMVASMDLRMFVMLQGRERTLADYEQLVARAGLRIERVSPLPIWGRAVIDCRRA